MTEVEKYLLKKDRQERLDHRDTVLAISSILATEEGKKLFKYMFKEFGVTDLPDPSMDGKILYEYLGHLRAGNSIYKLACEACYETTASLMAKIGKEAYEDKLEQYRIESGLTNASTDTSDD